MNTMEIKSDKNDLFRLWIQEIHENPHFSQEEFHKKTDFLANSKEFLGGLIQAIEKIPLTEIPWKKMEPLLKKWHGLLSEQLSKGFSVKDTAMLIFSLKGAITRYVKRKGTRQKKDTQPIVKLLENALDFLGLLTFELYSAEKERLIFQQKKQIEYLQTAQFDPQFGTLIGNSPQMNAVYKAIGMVLENDVTVLLEGESGTGKELIAQVIHRYSKRKEGPFVTVNCGAIPKELLESELFGHEKGSFTGAQETRVGKFELAQNSTLFLDEIGELPLDMQVKLLRAIQNREIDRIGSSEKIKVDLRIIAATNKNVKEEVKKGLFRLDLYYRLNVFPIRVPPLRERPHDILPLAQHFLEIYTKQLHASGVTLTDEARHWLITQNWEGNIRELENVIQRAVILAQGMPITRGILEWNVGTEIFDSHRVSSLALPSPKKEKGVLSFVESEKKGMENALLLHRGNIRKAAHDLGVSRTTFYNKAKKYVIALTRKKGKNHV